MFSYTIVGKPNKFELKCSGIMLATNVTSIDILTWFPSDWILGLIFIVLGVVGKAIVVYPLFFKGVLLCFVWVFLLLIPLYVLTVKYQDLSSISPSK